MAKLPTGSDAGNTIIIPGSACASFPRRNPTLISQRHRLVSTDLIHSALVRRLGCTSKKIRTLHEGKGSCLFMIENEKDKRFVMKIGLFLDHHDIAQELLFNAIVKSYASDIPVPGTYVLDLSAEIMPWPYSIIEWLPGKSILKIASKETVSGMERFFEQAGHCTRLIHDIKLPTLGYGNLAPMCLNEFITTITIPDQIRGIAETVSERYLNPARKTAAFLFDSSVITEQDHSAIDLILTTKVPEDDDIVIQHGDMSMGNFLIHRNRLTGVLDGSAVIGYRLEEIANAHVFICALELHFPSISADEALRAFLGGYGTGYEKVTHDSNYRFFLVTRLLNHIGILYETERLKQIPYYLGLLRKNF